MTLKPRYLKKLFFLVLILFACSKKEPNEKTVLIEFENRNSLVENDNYEGTANLLDINSQKTNPIKIEHSQIYLEKIPLGSYAISYQNIYKEPMIHAFTIGDKTSKIVIDRSTHFIFYEDYNLKTTKITEGDTLLIGVLNFTNKKHIKIWKESEKYFSIFPKLTASGSVEEGSYSQKEVTDFLDLFNNYEVELNKIDAIKSDCNHNEIDYFFILNNDTTIYTLNSCSWNGLTKLYSRLNHI